MKRLALLSVFAGLVVLGACGSDEEDDDGASDSTGSAGSPSSSTGVSSGGKGGEPSSGGGGAGAEGGGTGGDGPLPPGDWTCVGNVMWPAPMAETVTITAHAEEIQGGAAIPNIKVDACAKADPDCAAPITSGTTDANGDITLMLPTGTDGFDGYFQLTGNSIPDSLVFVNPPVTEDVADLTVPLLDSGTFGLFQTLTGIDADPTRGHIAAIGFDCAEAQGEGLHITASSADGTTEQIYIANNLPNADATQTDSSGATFILNLPTGASTLTSTFAANGDTVGKVEVLVRADHITYAILPPTP